MRKSRSFSEGLFFEVPADEVSVVGDAGADLSLCGCGVLGGDAGDDAVAGGSVVAASGVAPAVGHLAEVAVGLALSEVLLEVLVGDGPVVELLELHVGEAFCGGFARYGEVMEGAIGSSGDAVVSTAARVGGRGGG